MGDAIKSLLTSKKTWVGIATLVVWVATRFGLNLPSQEVTAAVLMFASLFVGYVMQDFGKGDVPPRTLKSVVFDLLSSKKAILVLGTCVIWVATRLGLHVSPATVATIMNGASALVLGIGFQDFGKEAAANAAANQDSVQAALQASAKKKK